MVKQEGVRKIRIKNIVELFNPGAGIIKVIIVISQILVCVCAKMTNFVCVCAKMPNFVSMSTLSRNRNGSLAINYSK